MGEEGPMPINRLRQRLASAVDLRKLARRRIEGVVVPAGSERTNGRAALALRGGDRITLLLPSGRRMNQEYMRQLSRAIAHAVGIGSTGHQGDASTLPASPSSCITE